MADHTSQREDVGAIRDLLEAGIDVAPSASTQLPAALGPTTPALSLSVTSAPSTTWIGSTVTLSTTGAAIGAGTSYNAGVLVTNTDLVIAMYLSTSIAACEVAATRYYLAPGASVVIPVASAAAIFARSASGAPLLSWIAAS